MNKVEPLHLPDEPKAPKKTTLELKLDEPETKTEAETRISTTSRVVLPLGTTKS